MSGAFDIAASYIYDIDQYYTPEIQVEKYQILNKDTKVNPPLTAEQLKGSFPSSVYGIKNITLKRNRIHRIGLDAKTVIDRFGIWGEACLSVTERKMTNHTNHGKSA